MSRSIVRRVERLEANAPPNGGFDLMDPDTWDCTRDELKAVVSELDDSLARPDAGGPCPTLERIIERHNKRYGMLSG